MLITTGDNLAGVPLRRLREFVRHNRHNRFSASFVAEWLQIGKEQAALLIDAMLHEGYLAPSASSKEKGWLEAGPRAGILASASAARPITRKTADRLVQETLERVATVNDSMEFAWRVALLVVFGSYLDMTKDRLSDVDLAVGLAAKSADALEQKTHDKQVLETALRNGRSFRSHFDYVFYPQVMVKTYLKSRSTGISLHCADTERRVWSSGSHKILFDGR